LGRSLAATSDLPLRYTHGSACDPNRNPRQRSTENHEKPKLARPKADNQNFGLLKRTGVRLVTAHGRGVISAQPFLHSADTLAIPSVAAVLDP